MDKKQFILETLLSYFENPETCAFDDDNCHYIMSDERRSAVGKHIQDAKVENLYGCPSSSDELFLKYGLGILTEKARKVGLSTREWSAI